MFIVDIVLWGFNSFFLNAVMKVTYHFINEFAVIVSRVDYCPTVTTVESV